MGLRRGGLTLAEVVLSLGLLAMISLSMVALFSKLLAASTKTSDLTAGRQLAQRVLDIAIRRGPGPSGDWGFGAGASQEIVTRDADRTTKFVYTVVPSLLKSRVWQPSSWRKSSLYNIEVEVVWWSEGGATDRPGMGRLSTKLSQVVQVIE